jgi:hypothetical protein
MPPKSMPWVTPDQLPEDNMLIQVTFKKNGQVYNYSMIGDTVPMAMSAKLRNMVVMNIMAMFAANAALAHDIDLVPGAIQAPDPKGAAENIKMPGSEEPPDLVTGAAASGLFARLGERLRR